MTALSNKHIVVFDGVCNFCNGAVNFIIQRDPKAVFLFTPIQSSLAKELIIKYEIDTLDTETFMLVKNEQCFVFSSAALEITKDLSGVWRILNVLRFVPKVIRDFVYRVVARNRYKLFGKKEVCMVPTDELKARFIGV